MEYIIFLLLGLGVGLYARQAAKTARDWFRTRLRVHELITWACWG